MLIYDAAVVLGASVLADGSASPALERRLAHGVALLQAGRVANLLLSGGSVSHERAEARVMRDLALAAGVAEARLVTEEQSRNTLDNARYSAPLLAERDWRRVLLVTDLWHMPRALYTFRRFGIAADGSAAPRRGALAAHIAAALREGVALPVYVWRLERLRRGGPPSA